MNAFLRGHRVLAVKKEFVADGENSFWSFFWAIASLRRRCGWPGGASCALPASSAGMKASGWRGGGRSCSCSSGCRRWWRSPCRPAAGPGGGTCCIDLGWWPTGSNRVIRGGSWNNWNNNARNCRSANRNNNNPDNRNNNLGFRVVLAPAHPERWMTLRLTRPPSRPRNAVFRGKPRWNKARCE